MTRKQARQDRSRLRSDEYQRKRRQNNVVLAVSLFLFAGVPVLWYGAVEFGYAHPIQNPDFKGALQMAAIVVILALIQSYKRFTDYRDQDEAREKEPDEQNPVI